MASPNQLLDAPGNAAAEDSLPGTDPGIIEPVAMDNAGVEAPAAGLSEEQAVDAGGSEIHELEPIFGKGGGPEAKAEAQRAASEVSAARQTDLKAEAARLDQGAGEARVLRTAESKQIGQRTLGRVVEAPSPISGSQVPFTNPASHDNPGLRYKF